MCDVALNMNLIAYAARLPCLSQKSENDPSHKGISKSMQLWRATAQISPSASDDVRLHTYIFSSFTKN